MSPSRQDTIEGDALGVTWDDMSVDAACGDNRTGSKNVRRKGMAGILNSSWHILTLQLSLHDPRKITFGPHRPFDRVKRELPRAKMRETPMVMWMIFSWLD